VPFVDVTDARSYAANLTWFSSKAVIIEGRGGGF
jgi:hypothetical protein